ncbi:MFS transporter [Streptomyces solincola]|uniref:MFS transporter n=1 Tax=Streptomyces solincola TaxID=2100817 RepID=UPI0021595141|nr:MFS transporter [Streptomyces solincola]
MTDPTGSDRAKPGAALAVLTAAVLLVSVDATVLLLALPSISESTGSSAVQLLWIGDVYSFVLAGLLISMGALGDRIGHRRLLTAGSAAFGAASLAAACSTAPWALIAARAALGVAGAAVMPSTLALIRAVFPEGDRRAKAVGLWGAAASAGAALGPVLGGALMQHFWWGSVFVATVPIAAAVALTARRLLPECRATGPAPWDAPSALLCVVGVLSLVYAVKETAVHGVGGPDVPAAALTAAVTLRWFLRRQRTLATPVLDPELFRDRRFTAAVLTTVVALAGLSGMLFLTAQYLQLVRGLDPLRAGLADLPGFLGSTLGGLAAAGLVRRTGVRGTLTGCLLLLGCGLAVFGWVRADTSYALLATAFLTVGLAEGAVYAAATALALDSAPAGRAGSAAAVTETAYELGAAAGIALLGSVLSGVYRARLTVPPDLAGHAAGQARESLGQAAETVAGLPAGPARALEEAARTAFLHGLRTTAVVAALVLLAVAVAVSLMLPGRSRDAADRAGVPGPGGPPESGGASPPAERRSRS